MLGYRLVLFQPQYITVAPNDEICKSAQCKGISTRGALRPIFENIFIRNRRDDKAELCWSSVVLEVGLRYCLNQKAYQLIACLPCLIFGRSLVQTLKQLILTVEGGSLPSDNAMFGNSKARNAELFLLVPCFLIILKFRAK
jgi:hypothetical protein